MYEQWTRVAHLTRDEQRELQNKRVRWFFQHKLPYSPFYRAWFEKHGLKFSDIQTVDDLEKIPLTSKLDIAPTAEEPAKPRQFILQPDEHLLKKYATKGELMKLIWMKLRNELHAADRS